MENGIPACNRHAKLPRQGRGVGCRRDEARAKQDLVDGNAALPRFGFSNRQCRSANPSLQKKRVLAAGRPVLRAGLRRLSHAALWRYNIAGNRSAMGQAIPRTALHGPQRPQPPQ